MFPTPEEIFFLLDFWICLSSWWFVFKLFEGGTIASFEELVSCTLGMHRENISMKYWGENLSGEERHRTTAARISISNQRLNIRNFLCFQTKIRYNYRWLQNYSATYKLAQYALWSRSRSVLRWNARRPTNIEVFRINRVRITIRIPIDFHPCHLSSRSRARGHTPTPTLTHLRTHTQSQGRTRNHSCD